MVSVSLRQIMALSLRQATGASFKTVSQMIMIILMIMDIQNTVFQGILTLFVVIAVALTIISLVDYITKNKSVLSMQD